MLEEKIGFLDVIEHRFGSYGREKAMHGTTFEPSRRPVKEISLWIVLISLQICLASSWALNDAARPKAIRKSLKM